MAGDGSEGIAPRECRLSYNRYTLGEGDGGEVVAIVECTASNARHALGEGDGSEAAAIIESMGSNARHAIRLVIKGNDRGNGDCVGVAVTVSSSIRHRYRQVGRGGDIVVDTVHLKVVGTCREAAQ